MHNPLNNKTAGIVAVMTFEDSQKQEASPNRFRLLFRH